MQQGLGASAAADRAAAANAVEPVSRLQQSQHPLRGDLVFTVDEFNRWSVFDKRSALGTFGTWAEADTFRKTHSVAHVETDDAPAWTPTSGGY